MNNSVYDLVQLSARILPGVYRKMVEAADALGISIGELVRASFLIEPSPDGPPRLVAQLCDQESVAVVGKAGRIVGTLGAVAGGRATIDGPESATYVEARLPIIVDWSDLERAPDGSLTGRLSPTRRIRKPGRRSAVRAARARSVADDLAGSA